MVDFSEADDVYVPIPTSLAGFFLGMTNDPPLDVSVDSLTKLEQFLTSDRVPDGCFRLPELDGFLTGVVVGPKPIPYEVWLPYVWGDGEPEFVDKDEARQILSTIIDRHNDIISVLENAPERYEPLLGRDREGWGSARDWSRGFLEAVRLAPACWAQLLDGEDQHLILPIAIHWPQGALGRPGMSAEPEVVCAAVSQLSTLLPACVLEVHAYWTACRSFEPTELTLDDTSVSSNIHQTSEDDVEVAINEGTGE
ncbi:conserved hypothetical protein [Azospirillaceae bacterium]